MSTERTDGPMIHIELSCFNCKHRRSEHYSIQGDSGFTNSCVHPDSFPHKHIGDGTCVTPRWCPIRPCNGLDTQDNAATENPIYVVYERDRVYGVEDGYRDGVLWVDDENAQQSATEVEGWRELGYKDTKRFVTAFFTRAAAEKFIERERHNLTAPEIFVHSLNSNPEMIAIRDALLRMVKQ